MINEKIEVNDLSTCLWFILCLAVRESIILFVYSHILCIVVSKKFFCTWSNQTRTIFNQPMDKTLTDTTSSDLSGPGSNSNEGFLHTSQISRIGASLSDTPECHT